MCGRLIVGYDSILGESSDSLLSEWITELPEGAQSSWNLSPGQQVPICFTSDQDGSKHFELAHWGIIPPWSKDGRPKFTFNARVETLMEKPTFAPSMRAQRCVFPVTGFYEWTGKKGRRTPHAIFGPEQILPLAGLYRWWKSPTGHWVLTSTILTRSSAGVFKLLHDRMPVFLADELLHDWLDPAVVGDQVLVDAVSELAVPYANLLREYAVRPLRGDGPDLLTPADQSSPE